MTTSETLSQTSSQPLNVTISIRVIQTNWTQTQVQFTNVYHPATAEAKVCLQGTLTQLVQQLLDADNHNLTFDVRTSCQFLSRALETINCSDDHLGRPYLAIFYRKSSKLSLRVIRIYLNYHATTTRSPSPCYTITSQHATPYTKCHILT